jgi:PAS domain S-box-containing protein
MFTTLPAFIWDAVLSSVIGSGSTSCVAFGGVFYVSALCALFHNVGGLQIMISLICVMAALVDAQGILSREERFRRAEDLCRMLIETSNDGIWITDGDHRTTFVNRRMAEMLGYRTEEIQGHLVVDFMFPDDVFATAPDFLRHPCLKKTVSNRFCRKDGSELWARISAGPLLGGDEEFKGMMIIARDVTRLRNMEDSLRRNEKLITAGRLTATITHEITSRVDAAASILCLLRSETMTEQGQQFLTLAEREIQRVSAIVKRTLSFFRDSSSWADVSLADLLDDTLSFYQNKFVAHSIRVVKDYRGPGIARVCRGAIEQVFANLVSNALDAMSSGGMLTVRVIDATNNKGVRVDVEDTGRGIKALDLKRVFDPFFTTKQNAGTGLGLWVVKEIIDKHGGRIAVTSTSQPGDKCGTRFSILLPRATAQAIA